MSRSGLPSRRPARWTSGRPRASARGGGTRRVRTHLGAALLLLAGLAAAAPTRAQVPHPMLLTLPGSTRAAAMGGAFGLSLVDSDAVFYNAAFNDRLRGAGASLARYGGGSTLYTLSAGTDWLGGGVGLSVQTIDYAGVGSGRGRDPGRLFGSEAAPVSEQAITLVYGRRVRGLRLALAGKHFQQRAAGERNELLLADLATAFTFRFLSVGVSAHNLGVPDYEVGGADVDVPWRALLGVATARSYPVGPLDVAGSAEVAYLRGGEVHPAAGVELAYWPITGRTFFLRGGVRRAQAGERPFTVGAGFAGDKLVLDYALEPFEGGREAHRFGVKWR